MKSLVKKGAIVILLGTGGVGKTTVAAALGMAGAMAGLNTAMITVDPARRLRDALGLARLGGEPERLDPLTLRAAGLSPDLRLSAMMLDVKGAWDALIEQFVADPRARRRILSNPFYQSMSGQFAGSEAYAALERLYDLHAEDRFDYEIVDTPPAAHAFEFLEAPARMIRLLDSRAARWLFTPSFSASKLAMRIAGQAARIVVRELERFAGAGMLTVIGDFFASAAEAVDSIADRFRKTQALVHSPAVRFVLVTTAEEDRLRRARGLIGEMEHEGLKLSAIVINRFLDRESWREILRGAGPGALGESAALRAALKAAAPDDGGLNAVARYLEDYRARAAADLRRVARFARAIPAQVALAIAPEISAAGAGDLPALAEIASFLTGAPADPESLRRAAGALAESAPRPRSRRARTRR